jgi:hypothetical protein
MSKFGPVRLELNFVVVHKRDFKIKPTSGHEVVRKASIFHLDHHHKFFPESFLLFKL